MCVDLHAAPLRNKEHLSRIPNCNIAHLMLDTKKELDLEVGGITKSAQVE